MPDAKGKPYSLLDDFKVMFYMLKKALSISKSFVVLSFFRMLCEAAVPVLTVVMPKFLIDEIMGQQRLPTLAAYAAFLVGGPFLIKSLGQYLETRLTMLIERIAIRLNEMLGEKAMHLDYEYVEDPEIIDLKEKASEGFGIIFYVNGAAFSMLQQIILSISFSYILFQLEYWILFILLAIVAVNAFFNAKLNKSAHRFWDRLMVYNKKWRYIQSIMMDFRYGKDVRLYDMGDLAMDRGNDTLTHVHKNLQDQTTTETKYNFIISIVQQLQMLAVYGYMIYQVIQKAFGIGSFSMYVAAANSFVRSVSEILHSVQHIQRSSQFARGFVEFMELKPVKPRNHKPVPTTGQDVIEFENVSFHYPRTEKYVLQHVSIKINARQKLSVVGQNGAGKTTFIKLLTRLYDPTEGRILLNGVDIREFDYDEYLKKFAVVFQDFGLVAASLRENICPADEKPDESRIAVALEKSGAAEFVDKLPKKLDTQVYKIFEQSGVEFSGGEAQKLAIARAICLKAPFIVLDEPTAALDPVAEFEIYQRFDKMVRDKATIYISHRMSSCRLCDVVAVFADGGIQQYGSHEELMRDSGGLYAAMFSAQAQYYV